MAGENDHVSRQPDVDAIPQPRDAGAMLVEYLRHRDVSCPRCEYSLRNAVSAKCPECGEPLRLTVGLEQPIHASFIALIVPGLACGLAAMVLSVLMTLHRGAPSQVKVATVIMYFSAAAAIVIIVRRRAFLRRPRSQQRMLAMGMGLLHLVFLTLFVYSTLI